MNSHGVALLKDVYGTSKLSKPTKKKSNQQNDGFIVNNNMDFYPIIEKNNELNKQIYTSPNHPEKIEIFDKSFNDKSNNIMPFGFNYTDGFLDINSEQDNYGSYYPVSNYNKSNQQPQPQPPQAQAQPPQAQAQPPQAQAQPQPPPQPQAQQAQQAAQAPPKNVNPYNLPILPKTADVNISPIINPDFKNVEMSFEEYSEYMYFKKMSNKNKKTIMDNQLNLSQNNSEGFANINDDFNDVLLFGLLGIFFLVFTDYIYKLGRKSY